MKRHAKWCWREKEQRCDILITEARKINNILEILSEVAELKIKQDCELSEYSTFKIGGEAELALFPESMDALVKAVGLLKENNVKYLIVGNGSNILFPDEGYEGAVVITTGLKSVTLCEDKMTAEAGASLIKLSIKAKNAGLTGLEFAYGIPGSVGGGVYMNAGAYDGAISQVLSRVKCYDMLEDKLVELSNDECDFSYRNSIFEKNAGRYVILEAEFTLEKGNKDEISAKMEDYMSRRREKQPLEYPSAGSAFKRLDGYFTAKLIDDAGLKGYTVGGAQVSEKHAGFIINKGGATAEDVKMLIAHIQCVIYEKYGLEIECEIRII